MVVLLHHIVIDAYDLPALAQFWTQVLGWQILSEREQEIVIGADETASVGICFMPVTDRKIVKNRLHLDLTTGADERDAEIERILALDERRSISGRRAPSRGPYSPTRREMSSAWSVPRQPSSARPSRPRPPRAAQVRR